MKQIAIDGPAGAGKSTIAKALAGKLGFMYVDTGAMYRTIALACLNSGKNLDDETSVSSVAQKADIDIKYEGGAQNMYLGGLNVTSDIRREEVGNAASSVSKYSAVRERLVALQKKLGDKYDVIMDGRDIGTVVLPYANLKIYLTASSKERAKRRFTELTEKGIDADISLIEKDIINRDENDMTRAISPLKKADDAIELDTSSMSIDEVLDEILCLWSKHE